MRIGSSSAVLIAAAAILSTTGPVAAQPAARATSQCFYSKDWSSWKPSADSTAIYIRVGIDRVYRLDLGAACPALQAPDVHLVTKIRGSSLICDALDLDLRVADDQGVTTGCILSKITPLSAAEAAALPKNLRP